MPNQTTPTQIPPAVALAGAAKNGTDAFKVESRDRFPMHSTYVDAEQIAKFIAQRAGACVCTCVWFALGEKG